MMTPMRTTLDIDDDVLQAAKEIGAMRRKTVGQVISEYARKAMIPPDPCEERNGVPILRRHGGSRRIITSAEVKRLQEDD
jgi:hypothetical protein